MTRGQKSYDLLFSDSFLICSLEFIFYIFLPAALVAVVSKWVVNTQKVKGTCLHFTNVICQAIYYCLKQCNCSQAILKMYYNKVAKNKRSYSKYTEAV